MNGQDHQRNIAQRAWEMLAHVETHPKVGAWLAEADALRSRRHAARRRRFVWSAAAGIVLALGVAGTVAYLQAGLQRFATNVGEQRDVVLADGSRVTLNTGTALAVRYTGAARSIELERGEALFAVKKDPARPFEVAAGGTLTRAIGTEFNVDLRSSKVTVSVLDGAVRISTAQSAAGAEPAMIALAKGQSAEFGIRERRLQTAQADLKRIDAWRTRRLEFSDLPLAAAVEEFNRYCTSRLVIGTPGLAGVRVSGVFRIGDTDGFLFSLQEALRVESHPAGNEIVLLRPQP